MILVPLPIWLAIVLLFPLYFITRSRFDPVKERRRRSWLHRIVIAIYYVLIVCNILMHTLEIVRLALLPTGIGLLPFAYVGLLLGAALHFTGGFGGNITAWLAINEVIWLGGMTMSIVKVIGLHNEGIERKGSKYPMSDQILDVAVIAGVYAVIAILEAGLYRFRR